MIFFFPRTAACGRARNPEIPFLGRESASLKLCCPCGFAHLQCHINAVISVGLTSLPSWHKVDPSVQLLVANLYCHHPCTASSVTRPCCCLSLWKWFWLETNISSNRGFAHQQWGLCCTVCQWLYLEQILGPASPVSSRNCMSCCCPRFALWTRQCCCTPEQQSSLRAPFWLCYLGSHVHENLLLVVTVPM